VLTSAQLGLEIGSALGQSYLVPFKNHGTDETQLIIGFKGWLALIHRGGQVASIDARAVHEADLFDYQYGDESYLRHKPAEGDRGPVTHYYCVAKTKNGGRVFEVMSRAEVEKHRDRYAKKSAGAITGPWATHFDDMALKTVFKRIFKWLPVSIEQQFAASVDEGIILRAGADEDPEVKFIDVDPDTGEVVDDDE
jgi:recombination protein RecT